MSSNTWISINMRRTISFSHKIILKKAICCLTSYKFSIYWLSSLIDSAINIQFNIIALLIAMNRHIRPNKTCLTPPPFTEVLVPSQEYLWSAICVLGVYIISFCVLFDIVLLKIIPTISFFILIVFHLDIFVIICT